MNQESEQPTKTSKYVLVEVSHRAYIALPLDTFIEMDGSFTIVEKEGFGDEEQWHVRQKPVDFKLLDAEEMTAIRVKSKLLGEDKKN